MDIYNTIGLSGSVLFLLAYFLMQCRLIGGRGKPYLWMNLAGAVMLLISLSHYWNLPMAITEGAWGLISVYGLFRASAPQRAGGQ